MQSTTKQQLFTEITTEEAAAINGGLLGRFNIPIKISEVIFNRVAYGLQYDWRSRQYYYSSRNSA